MRTIEKKWAAGMMLAAWMMAGCHDSAPDIRHGALPDANTGPDADAGPDVDAGLETPDWTWETHGQVSPHYDQVFGPDVLNFFIVISPENWQILQQDMDEHLQNVQMGPGIDLSAWDPVFVPCTLEANGRTWYQVGIRVKGNSSLVAAYKSGIQKFSFKLDFDEFEDVWPQIRDQRFYGFKQLNLKNNFDDPGQLHEHLGMQLMQAAGLAAPRTRLATLTLDAGDGPRYYGVYTLVEEPDDTLIKTSFADGNLYKPDGAAATFAAGTWDEAGYGKENHENAADFSDVRALYDALHSPDRLTAPETWRAQLEAAFDVDAFLTWLAANTVIQNWDSYGMAPHNYYLAFAPDAGRLVWIPWDMNEAFTDGRERGVLSLGLSEVDERWPLIRFLLDDSVFSEAYWTAVRRFADEIFTPEAVCARIREDAAKIRDAVRAERPPYTFARPGMDFDALTNALCERVAQRHAQLDFLGSEVP